MLTTRNQSETEGWSIWFGHFIAFNNNETEEQSMNQSEMKRRYPPGTRILLLQMGDDPRPIEANTKGTVRVIDDIVTLHGDFDNGRQLGIVPGCWRQT